MEKIILGNCIHVNEEGFMIDFCEWDTQVGNELAKELEIEMSPRHWEVIDYIQGEFKNKSPLSIRRIGKSGIVDIKEFYSLFPKAPLKTASKIAGIPKPVGCI
jgi:TusE/DsrC/DsvC family sulfur relay protein